jgi:hypothetical protein
VALRKDEADLQRLHEEADAPARPTGRRAVECGRRTRQTVASVLCAQGIFFISLHSDSPASICQAPSSWHHNPCVYSRSFPWGPKSVTGNCRVVSNSSRIAGEVARMAPQVFCTCSTSHMLFQPCLPPNQIQVILPLKVALETPLGQVTPGDRFFPRSPHQA